MPASIYTDNVRSRKTPTPPLKEPSLLSDKNLTFLESIKKSYPDFAFRPGHKFLFRPPKTIRYIESDENFRLLLLHELAHAILGHFSFDRSLERLQIERDAWAKTRELCSLYSIPFDEEFAEAELNTYRDWVHQKTLCKHCGLSCLEVSSESLYCPFCQKFYKKT